jgi:hypothetical protein
LGSQNSQEAAAIFNETLVVLCTTKLFVLENIYWQRLPFLGQMYFYRAPGSTITYRWGKL